MRIVLSFESLVGFGGTESYSVTVARQLIRLGHDAAIYSPNRGASADAAIELGIPVLRGSELPRSCDLVVSSDAATYHDLVGRGLDAVLVFVVHSADFMLQAPPQLSDRCDAVVVLNDRVRRAVEGRAWHAPIVRLNQPIDLFRYRNRGAGRPAARTALVATNYVTGTRAEVIEEACRDAGLEVSWIGATTAITPSPEFAIAAADVVIGLGRTTLEAMAAGKAAYVYGVVGGDGWVTPERYAAMEADGFAGTAFPDVMIDAAAMTEGLRGWRADMGECNRDLASAHHSAREHAIKLVELARALVRPPERDVMLSDELARLIRLQWYSDGQAATSQREVLGLRAQLDERDGQAADVASRLAAAEAQLASLKATRRYRLASRVAEPLDRLRKVRGWRT
jgi:hypothetical protein